MRAMEDQDHDDNFQLIYDDAAKKKILTSTLQHDDSKTTDYFGLEMMMA